MDIQQRARSLKNMLDKQASPSPLPFKPSVLFPKLKDANKPPTLTSDSQPTINLTNTELPTLPKMRVNGSKPKFTSPMKSGNPYNKN